MKGIDEHILRIINFLFNGSSLDRTDTIKLVDYIDELKDECNSSQKLCEAYEKAIRHYDIHCDTCIGCELENNNRDCKGWIFDEARFCKDRGYCRCHIN